MLKFTNDTSTFPLDELLVRWRRGDLTETQMVGHLLQHITHIDKRVLRLEQPPAGDPPRPPTGPGRKPSAK